MTCVIIIFLYSKFHGPSQPKKFDIGILPHGLHYVISKRAIGCYGLDIPKKNYGTSQERNKVFFFLLSFYNCSRTGKDKTEKGPGQDDAMQKDYHQRRGEILYVHDYIDIIHFRFHELTWLFFLYTSPPSSKKKPLFFFYFAPSAAIATEVLSFSQPIVSNT